MLRAPCTHDAACHARTPCASARQRRLRKGRHRPPLAHLANRPVRARWIPSRRHPGHPPRSDRAPQTPRSRRVAAAWPPRSDRAPTPQPLRNAAWPRARVQCTPIVRREPRCALSPIRPKLRASVGAPPLVPRCGAGRIYITSPVDRGCRVRACALPAALRCTLTATVARSERSAPVRLHRDRLWLCAQLRGTRGLYSAVTGGVPLCASW